MENYYSYSAKQLSFNLQTNPQKGLLSSEAHLRLKHTGLNELVESKRKGPFLIFLHQFKSVLVLILLSASIFTFLLNDILDSLMIVIIILINTAIGFFQEYRIEKILQDFKKMVTSHSLIFRDGKLMEIPSQQLVPGDLIIVEEGQKIAADIRLISANNLFTMEAVLTGESLPIEKNPAVLDDNTPLGDRKNMLFSGTIVTSGKGTGIVVATGMQTEIGRIFNLAETQTDPVTPMQKKLDYLGKQIGIIVIILSLLIGAIMLTSTKHTLIEVILSSATLAVAAVPEGLPAVVTISLAIGAKRLLKKGALLKNLPSAETLGSTNVICVDKTGTLTTGTMKAEQLFVNHNIINLTTSSLKPDRTLTNLLTIATLSSNARLQGDEVIGDPTEKALIKLAEQNRIDTINLNTKYPRVHELLFDSKRKMMSTVSGNISSNIIAVKGAIEGILDICTAVEINGQVKPLTKEIKKEILAANEEMAEKALRVLAFAFKKSPWTNYRPNQIEKDLIFAGLIGLADPPRPEVKEAIRVCQEEAGIKVVMITGDYLTTAHSIAQLLNIEGRSITGSELDKMSDEELSRLISEIGVYARVTPEHKIRIIKSLQQSGFQVAMTGDGVNDAPSLKSADIGISLGISGTDVAKDSSDMILMDDHFKTIIEAVKEGRTIYDNIRKFVEYLLTCNSGEVFVVVTAILLGLPIPLLPIHLLWINLITDGLPAIALSIDPPRKNIMKISPMHFSQEIIDQKLIKTIIFSGILFTAAVIPSFILYQDNLGLARSMVFTGLVLFGLLRILSIRWEYGLHPFSNKYLSLATATSIMLQLSVIYLPIKIGTVTIQELFKVQPLGLKEWGILVVSGGLFMLGSFFLTFFKTRFFLSIKLQPV